MRKSQLIFVLILLSICVAISLNAAPIDPPTKENSPPVASWLAEMGEVEFYDYVELTYSRTAVSVGDQIYIVKMTTIGEGFYKRFDTQCGKIIKVDVDGRTLAIKDEDRSILEWKTYLISQPER